jgi:hypothetical protein
MKNGFSLSLFLCLFKHTIEIVPRLLTHSSKAFLHVNEAITKLNIKIILPNKYNFKHINHFFNHGNQMVVSIKVLLYSLRPAFKKIWGTFDTA